MSVKAIKLEFPEFITHIPQSKKKWIKIGYNKIYSSSHYTVRAAFVAALHKYIEKHIPKNLTIKTPISTHLEVHVPINYGNVKSLMNKKTGIRKINWKKPAKDHKPNWDIGNLALVWLKSLDDMLVKKGVIPDDTVEFLIKSTYEYIPTKSLNERKLIYNIKTIK